MLFSNLEDHVCRQIILDHYSRPNNKSKISPNEGYFIHDANNIGCIDDISVAIKFEDDHIIDAKFDGIACAIATSSTDIFCDIIKNKDIIEVEQLIKSYMDLIANKDCNKEALKEAVAFKNIYRQTSRIGCATIGINAIEKIINDYKEKQKTLK